MLLKFPDETAFEDFSTHLLYVVRLEFQPDSSKTSQELALISDIPVEKPDIEIFSQANEVPFRIRFHDLPTEDITIELTNTVSLLPRN